MRLKENFMQDYHKPDATKKHFDEDQYCDVVLQEHSLDREVQETLERQ
jgi:hypothetical protein